MDKQSTILKFKTFSSFNVKVKPVPELISRYLGAEKKEEGKIFSLKLGGRSRDTGAGMEYASSLTVSHEGKIVFDTGLMVYRYGRSQGLSNPDNWDRCINEVKLIDETENEAIFGYRSGTGIIRIYTCKKNGDSQQLEKFDFASFEKEMENQKEPTGGDFSKWVCRHINEERVNCEIKYNCDEKLCVVLATHSNRDFDATTDWYQIFVWSKEKGLAKSDKYHTRARSTTSFGSTNYLRVEISMVNDSEILFKANSQYRDFEICKTFILE